MGCSCEYDDGERAEFSRRSQHKARKPHRCVDCHMTIVPGEVYTVHAGKWEGDFHSIKVCAGCLNVRKVLCGCAPFGDLWADEGLRDFPDEWFHSASWPWKNKYGDVSFRAVWRGKQGVE